MAPTYKLNYFNFYGIGEPLRLIFHYAKVDFEDARIDRDNWNEVRDNFPWKFLPVLEVDGGFTLSQSYTIGRYLGKKFNLAGSNDEESAKCDEYGDSIKDFVDELKKLFFEKDEEKKKEIKKRMEEEVVPKYLAKFSSIIDQNGGKYLVGNTYTWPDMFFAHFMSRNENLDKFPVIKAYSDTFFNVPQIKEWVEKRPVTAM